jgi:hypothetical protein
MDRRQLVDTLDFRYVTDVFAPDDAPRLQCSRAAGKSKRIAKLREIGGK